MTRTAFVALREFFQCFGRLPFYDTGFGDVVRGAAHSDDPAELVGQLYYIKGYADCARLASPYMGPHWRIAHLMGIVAGTFAVLIELDRDDATPLLAVDVDRLVHEYGAELAELCRQKGAA